LFTDLDGTLLDFETYLPSRQAESAIRRLGVCGVAVVPVSSKTAAEVLPLMGEIGLDGPAVTEGGGVIIDRDGAEHPMGLQRKDLIAVLDRLRERGVPVRGMSEMDVDEVVGRTGLASDAARRAMTRHASEPFVVSDPEASPATAAMDQIAARFGAAVIRGGRFWPLVGAGVDKAVGLREALRLLGTNGPTAAVGDAWNDLPMLAAVDHGFLLGDAVSAEDTPSGVTRVDVCGPAGFTLVADRLADTWCAPDAE
jgi:mannosyl-3-phosphoglycerate phosphatase